MVKKGYIKRRGKLSKRRIKLSKRRIKPSKRIKVGGRWAKRWRWK